METVFQICLSNTIVALGVALAAIVAGAIGRRPALRMGSGCCLIKLVTPPLLRVPLTPVAVPAPSHPAQVGAVVDPAGSTAPRREVESSGRDRTAVPAAGLLDFGRSRSSLARNGNVSTAVASRIPSSSYALALSAWIGIAALWWGWTARRVRRFSRLLRWAWRAPDDVQGEVRAGPRLGLADARGLVRSRADLSHALALARVPRLLVPESLWDRPGADQRLRSWFTSWRT